MSKSGRENRFMNYAGNQLLAYEKYIEELTQRTAELQKEVEELKKRLTICCQYLGHPAYEHSYLIRESIDELRKDTFDYLGVPKSQVKEEKK